MQHIQKSCRADLLEIKRLNNQALLLQTKALVQKERNIHVRVLHHLKEIEARKLYFEQGFSSLFDYAVKELGYSEGAAFRRIKAMRLFRDMPETENSLKEGKLTLSSASQLQNFFEKKARQAKSESQRFLSQTSVLQKESMKMSDKSDSSDKATQEKDLIETNSKQTFQNEEESVSVFPKSDQAGPLSAPEKRDLLKKAEGLSARQTERLLSESDPSVSSFREKARFLGRGKVEMRLVIDEDCYKKFEELKNLLSHRNPSLSSGKAFQILVDEGLKKHDPLKKNKIVKRSASFASTQKPQPNINPSSASTLKPQPNTNPLRASAPKPQPNTNPSSASTPKPEPSKSVSKPMRKKTDNISINKNLSENRKLETYFNEGRNKVKLQKELVRRHISAQIRRDIRQKHQGRCVYVHPQTGKRCNSKYLLQIDHIKPFALGGGSERENLRLLCAGHNLFRNKRAFPGR